MNVQLPDEIREEAEILVAGLEGGRAPDLTIDRLEGGANNQVFLVESPASHYCLKWYFSHPDDPRDRLKHEWEFLQYAWSKRITNIPRPLAVSRAKNLALYQWIDGTNLTQTNVNEYHIDQAIELVYRLNQDRESAEAHELPFASEACFAWQEHLAHVDRRLDRLISMPVESEIHREAAEFVNDRLSPAWQAIRRETEVKFSAPNSLIDRGTEDALRVVSPSDFGFHNALLDRNGVLYFIDFEYAGWDGLVKLICDFFHQPEVPVPRIYLGKILDELASRLGVPGELAEPICSFLPVYGVKWCCILLNEFLPTGQSRRAFSRQAIETPEKLARQLAKANEKLHSLLAGE